MWKSCSGNNRRGFRTLFQLPIHSLDIFHATFLPAWLEEPMVIITRIVCFEREVAPRVNTLQWGLQRGQLWITRCGSLPCSGVIIAEKPHFSDYPEPGGARRLVPAEPSSVG